MSDPLDVVVRVPTIAVSSFTPLNRRCILPVDGHVVPQLRCSQAHQVPLQSGTRVRTQF